MRCSVPSPRLAYAERLERLRANGVAVWDVLAAGEREGSLDSAIEPSTIVVNDFGEFFARHRGIRLICFNGNTAAGLYRRKVQPGLAPERAAIETRVLPSTSPAYASLALRAEARAVVGRAPRFDSGNAEGLSRRRDRERRGFRSHRRAHYAAHPMGRHAHGHG